MSKLDKLLEEHLQKIPLSFLKEILKEKLEELGIENAELLDSLTEHIVCNKGEALCWDDGNGKPIKNLDFEITKNDLDELEKSVTNFLNNNLTELILLCVDDAAKSVVKDFERSWPEIKIDEQAETRHFRERLDFRWSSGLDPLRMLLILSREAGQNFSSKLNRSKAKKNRIAREILSILHMRACQTTLEILTLLESGLPDGAYARWRTLYEISVVAFVIDKFGDEIAERYLAHEVVSHREAVINEFRIDGKSYNVKALRGDLKELEKDYQSSIVKYGQSFASPYGWAAHNLNLKRPRFKDLELAVDWDALPPQYKSSSYKIHAGVTGAIRSLSYIDGQDFIHAGATNLGIEVPAVQTAYSITQITSLMIGNTSSIEVQIQLKSIIMLRNKVVRECRKATRKLEKDEAEFQKGYEI